MTKHQQELDHANVKIPPLLYLLICLGIGKAADSIFPLNLIDNRTLSLILGTSFLILGTIIISTCVYLFRKNKTHLRPWKPTHLIITNGLYAFSRNPIYLALALIGLGIALSLNGTWMTISLIPFMLLIQFFVISKEERYLEKKFGKPYLQYKKDVGRWISFFP